jgi:hypothetical protein
MQQHSALSTQHSALSIQHSALSALSTQHSALGITQRSTQHSAPSGCDAGAGDILLSASAIAPILWVWTGVKEGRRAELHI